MNDSMENEYRENGYTIQFVDAMCGDSGKYVRFPGPVICKYDDGFEYQGEWQDGKKHGIGTYTYPDGSKYVGEWKDDKKHGEGTNIWSDAAKYEGQFKDGK